MRRLARALTCALVLIGALSVAVAPPAAAAENRAVVVIDTGAGSRRVVINFSGTITGIQALQLAGANPVLYAYSGQGAAVCALDGVGHDPTDNSCLGTQSDPRYWAYFRALGGAGSWSPSPRGAGATTVSDGDVEGWRFGTGQAPPFSSFCDVVGCAPPPPTPASPPSRGSGGSGGSGGSSGGGETNGGGGTTAGGSAAGTAPGAAGSTTPGGVSEPVVTTQPEPVVTTTGPASDGRRGQALGVRVPGGPDDGSGSPWGLIVAGGVAIGVVTATAVRRRRRSAA